VKKNFAITLLLSLFVSVSSSAQNDSIFVSVNEFIAYIKTNHPLLKKYQLVSKAAKQELLSTKGMLDPSISSNLNQKQFDDKNYFSVWDNQLKIPTWFGPDIKLGYESNSGSFLNNSDFVPNSGLVAMGLSVPIGQGMLIDARRNAVKQARLFTKLAEAEQTKFINKFLLEAIKDYWEWHFTYNKLMQLNNSYNFSRNVYQFTVERVKQGDAAPIDSVEVSINMQTILNNLYNAQIEYFNSGMVISTYLWKDENTPLELSPNMYPEHMEPLEFRLLNDSLQKSIDWSKINNPEIRKQQYKIEQLKVEQFFSKNSLLPKIQADAAFITSGSDFQAGRYYSPQNYKLGGNLYVPLFLRKERGKLNAVRIKLLDANYELQQINREVENGIKANLNECLVNWNQINLQKNVVRNSEKLRNAEKTNFDNGESSAFLINTREMSLLNQRIKYYEMIMKYQKAQATLYNTIGNLTSLYGIN
jgi:outer membrane protein TolC